MVGLFLARPAIAHAAGISDEETQFVFNTFAFLIWGALVMWMCAGFTMLESGSVRTKNASMICLKNIGLYSIAGLAYFFVGYNLMYGDTHRAASSASPPSCTDPPRTRSHSSTPSPQRPIPPLRPPRSSPTETATP